MARLGYDEKNTIREQIYSRGMVKYSYDAAFFRFNNINFQRTGKYAEQYPFGSICHWMNSDFCLSVAAIEIWSMKRNKHTITILLHMISAVCLAYCSFWADSMLFRMNACIEFVIFNLFASIAKKETIIMTLITPLSEHEDPFKLKWEP